MRIIRGKYGKRRFTIPKTFKARPTTDLAKENLFNVLENIIDWEGKRALDLFAGTGSMGFEFLSRGCEEVVAVEADKQHYEFLKEISKKLGDPAYIPVRADVFSYISGVTKPFNIVFADPPYQMENIAQLPDLLAQNGVVAPVGTVIIEHPKEVDMSHHPYFEEKRVYGSVNFSIFFYP